MANPKGIITRKDIIEDEALKFGDTYAESVTKAIDANKILVDSVKELNKQVQNFKTANNQKDYITAKQAATLATQQAISAIKIEQAEDIKRNKIKQEALKTSEAERKAKQAATDADIKAQKVQQASVKLTIEERVQNEINNKALKQETLERLGLVSAYTKLNKARTDAKNKLRDLISAEKSSTEEIKKATIEFNKFDAKVKKADQAVGDFSKNVGNYKSAFSGLGSLFAAFGIAGGIAGIISASKEIYNTTKELQSLDLALKSVTGTEENFGKQQIFLTTIADKYGLEIKNLTKQYTAFYVAAKDKLAAGEIQDLFENIAKSGAALGLSNETLERSFVAINQMLSKGTVASEELRGQLAEALPGSVQAMVKAVQILHPEIKNLTEKGLFEMIKAGEILASDVLPETARQLVLVTGADKAEGIDTITKSTNRLTDAWIKLVRATAQSKVGKWIDESVSSFFDTISGTLEKITLQVKGFNASLKDAALIGQGIGEKNFRTDFRTATEDPKNKTKSQEQIRTILREGYTWEFNAAKDNLERLEKLRQTADIANRTQREQDVLEAKITFQEAATKIRLSRIQIEKETSSAADGLSDSEKRKQEKLDKEKLDAEKRLSDSLYELLKQRLEQIIKFNQEIASDEEQTDGVRIIALMNSQNKQLELTNLTKQHLLDADKFVLEKDRLNANEKQRITEDAENKIVEIKKKTAKEIDKINEFDSDKYKANLEKEVATTEIAMNNELAKENERFAALGDLEAMAQKDREKAIEDHERNIFDIKLAYAKAIAKLQADNLQTELDAFKAQSDGSDKSNKTILDIEKRLSDARLKLTELGLDNYKTKEKEKTKSVKEQTEEILQISSDMTGALSDLANSFSQAKIQKIDDEINKNNEYYNQQIELAGNDIRQKELLEKERDKKNEVLEKKKKAAQHKQAVFDKAVTIAQIAIQTALAIMKAAPNPASITLAAVLGAIQLATAIATPIPKYKHGRKGGPAEFAEVGDGFVHEIIEKKDGRAFMTPNKPTLTYLEQGDKVHSTVEDYYRLQRSAMMLSIDMQGRKMSDFQATQNFESNNKELVEEMRLTRKAIEKNKTNIIVNVPKADLSHEIWKANNKNWNQ